MMEIPIWEQSLPLKKALAIVAVHQERIEAEKNAMKHEIERMRLSLERYVPSFDTLVEYFGKHFVEKQGTAAVLEHSNNVAIDVLREKATCASAWYRAVEMLDLRERRFLVSVHEYALLRYLHLSKADDKSGMNFSYCFPCHPISALIEVLYDVIVFRHRELADFDIDKALQNATELSIASLETICRMNDGENDDYLAEFSLFIVSLLRLHSGITTVQEFSQNSKAISNDFLQPNTNKNDNDNGLIQCSMSTSNTIGDQSSQALDKTLDGVDKTHKYFDVSDPKLASCKCVIEQLKMYSGTGLLLLGCIVELLHNSMEVLTQKLTTDVKQVEGAEKFEGEDQLAKTCLSLAIELHSCLKNLVSWAKSLPVDEQYLRNIAEMVLSTARNGKIVQQAYGNVGKHLQRCAASLIQCLQNLSNINAEL